jgi:hypothetical protein
METKQTALQWFLDKLPHAIETQFSEQIKQALQMEREQIIDFCQMWEDSPLEKYDCKEDLFIELYGK